MNARLRRLALILFAAAAAAVTFHLDGGTAAAMADGVCMNGYNWDNVRNICV
jgi:hypothetical protein